MSRINEIVQAEEAKAKNTIKIDKESSARIIKRSLWMNATNKNKVKVNELVNSTLESTIKRSNTDQEEEEVPGANKKVKFDDIN